MPGKYLRLILTLIWPYPSHNRANMHPSFYVVFFVCVIINDSVTKYPFIRAESVWKGNFSAFYSLKYLKITSTRLHYLYNSRLNLEIILDFIHLLYTIRSSPLPSISFQVNFLKSIHNSTIFAMLWQVLWTVSSTNIMRVIDLAQDGDRWRSLVNVVVNLWVP
jgi:hypothetical protein